MSLRQKCSVVSLLHKRSVVSPSCRVRLTSHFHCTQPSRDAPLGADAARPRGQLRRVVVRFHWTRRALNLEKGDVADVAIYHTVLFDNVQTDMSQ